MAKKIFYSANQNNKQEMYYTPGMMGGNQVNLNAYNPNQPRDPKGSSTGGQWTESPSSSTTYNDGKPYYRYGNPKTPMSEWGHAMFLDNPSHLEGSSRVGLVNYEFKPESGDSRVVSSQDLRPLVIQKLNDWKENGVPPNYQFTYMEELVNGDEFSFEQIADGFSPKDIVDSAGNFDNADLNSFLYNEILEPNGWYAVITPDGAIVYDESMIRRID